MKNVLTIDAGNGTDNTFNTGGGFRIFNIDDGTTTEIAVTLRGLTHTGGDHLHPTTTTTSNRVIIMNSPLHITGTDIASGQAFSYSYATSTETITYIPEPSTLALCCLFGLGGAVRRRR